MAGVFIVFEGPEGSGKSTQAKRLATILKRSNREIVLTREPGGTPIGEQVRTILLDQANYDMLPKTEALLYTAARAQHVGAVIAPALERGAFVVCDRFVDSTIAYQAAGRGLSVEDLRSVQTFAVGSVVPDLRILLDLPVEIGLQRRFGSAETVNRLDEADLEFHQRVRAAYLKMATEDPGGWFVINADDAPDAIEKRIAGEVAQRFEMSAK